MLAEAKDSSELMIDLAYAALYFGDPDMAEEVGGLEETLSELIQDMRGICILAVRNPREAEGMSSVLQVISAIERMANDAVDIARIVTHKVGIPAELVADLSQAEEISHRVLVSEGSHLAHRPLSAHELPVQTGMRVMAVRRERQWITDVGGDLIVMPGDALFLRGSPDGITRLRELAAADKWTPPVVTDDPFVTDLDRAVDVLVEMKDISEVAVGLAYSALVLGDPGLAAEVRQLEDRLDEMKDRLELWVLRAASGKPDPSPLRGLLQLARRPRTSAIRRKRWSGSSSRTRTSIRSSGSRSVIPTRSSCRCRSAPTARPTVGHSPNSSSTSNPASPCSPFVAVAGTATVRAAGCGCWPAMRSSQVAPMRAANS
jgi:uncharacterized protein with PhoU and TrkA domain